MQNALDLSPEPRPYRRLVRNSLDASELREMELVDSLASALVSHIAARSAEIDAVHVHGAQSGTVQLIMSQLLCGELGFVEEKRIKQTFGLVTQARPDFIRYLGAERGILAEVERGGTTTNNHDLKDFWKAHIAPDAHHLFLVVPLANWKEDGSAREKPFDRVCSRLGAFFGDERREVDVMSAHVFGYGRSVQRSATDG